MSGAVSPFVEWHKPRAMKAIEMCATNLPRGEPAGEKSVLSRLRDWLTSQGVTFREVHHEPTTTSEQSARARGEELRVGGKALLMKGDDDQFRLFVLPADRKVDSSALRQKFGFKKLRFATPDELKAAATGLVPGSVPPFGRPILPFDLYVDAALRERSDCI